MIGRLHRRDEFERLRRQGSRVRSGVVWCMMLPDPELDGPRMAFAIGRSSGDAVDRNRARRRIREAFRRIDLPSGLYLVGLTVPATSVTFAHAVAAADGIAKKVSL
ncbi:MAG: ribonuclease P protein component [Solirubrobacterales bacterium]